MTLRDEQSLARQLMNTVIEAFQSNEGFNDWFTKLSAQEQQRLSIVLMRYLKRNVREIESVILGKEFFKNERQDGEDVS